MAPIQIQFARCIPTGVFETLPLADFCERYESLARSSATLCQVFSDTDDIRPVFDIDSSHATEAEMLDAARRIAEELVPEFAARHFPGGRANLLSAVGRCRDPKKEKAATPWKASFHLYIAGVRTTGRQLARLCALVGKEGLGEYLDAGIYCSKKKLRSVGCSKAGEDRPLEPWAGSSRDIRDYIVRGVEEGWEAVEFGAPQGNRGKAAAGPTAAGAKAKAKAVRGKAGDGAGTSSPASSSAPAPASSGSSSGSLGQADEPQRPPVAPEVVRALLATLSDARARDRAQWRAVATALKHEGARTPAGPDAYLSDWLAFSRRGGDKYESDEDCRTQWDGLAPNGQLRIGSLFHAAESDDPAGYAKAVSPAAATLTAKRVSPTPPAGRPGDADPSADSKATADPWLVTDLLAALAPKRRDAGEAKEQERIVAALRHAGGERRPEAFSADWVAWFSEGRGPRGEREALSLWDSFKRQRGRPVTFAALAQMAREDAPEAAEAALAAARARGAALSPDRRGAASRFLAEALPDKLGRLCADTTHFQVREDGRRLFQDPASGLRGWVDRWNGVFLEQSGGAVVGAGYLGAPLAIGGLGFIKATIPPAATFLYKRESPERAQLSSEEHRVNVAWLGDPDVAAGQELQLSMPGRNDSRVTDPGVIRKLVATVMEKLDEQATADDGMRLLRSDTNIAINNGFVNHGVVVNVQVPDRGDDMAATEGFVDWLHSQGYRLVYCEGLMYMYEPGRGTYRHLSSNHGLRRLIGKCPIGEYSRNAGRQDALFKMLPDWAPEDELFLDRALATSARKLAFSNGYFDFDTRSLRPFNPDVIFFRKLPHAYPTTPEAVAAATEMAAEISQRVLEPIWGDATEFVLRSTARCAAGEFKDKRIFFCVGKGNSGKGLFAELVKSALKPLFGTVNPNNLLHNRTYGDQAKALSWMRAARDCRVMFSNEIKNGTGLSIDGNVLKMLASGGDDISARQNHENETTFKMQGMLWLLANDLPPIDPLDDAVRNRLVVIDMPNVFHEVGSDEEFAALCAASPRVRRQDPDLKEWVSRFDVGAAFAYQLCQSYTRARPIPPPSVARETGLWVAEDCIEEKIRQVFARGGPGDYVLCGVAFEAVKKANITVSKRKLFGLLAECFGVGASVNITADAKGYRGIRLLDMTAASDPSEE